MPESEGRIGPESRPALDLRIGDARLASARPSWTPPRPNWKTHARRFAEAELRVSRMTIRSPMDGLVLRRIKSPGDKVMMGMDDPRRSSMYDPDKLQVRTDVPLPRRRTSSWASAARCSVRSSRTRLRGRRYPHHQPGRSAAKHLGDQGPHHRSRSDPQTRDAFTRPIPRVLRLDFQRVCRR